MHNSFWDAPAWASYFHSLVSQDSYSFTILWKILYDCCNIPEFLKGRYAQVLWNFISNFDCITEFIISGIQKFLLMMRYGFSKNSNFWGFFARKAQAILKSFLSNSTNEEISTVSESIALIYYFGSSRFINFSKTKGKMHRKFYYSIF